MTHERRSVRSEHATTEGGKDRRVSRGVALAAAGLLAFVLTACGAANPEAPASSESAAATPSASAEPSSTPQPTEEPEPSAEDIEGRWCPTPESPADRGCVTIALPQATYDDGTVVSIVEHGGPTTQDDGGFGFSAIDAPFGSYYPEGIALALPDYYPGADLPEQDRIWNGQTGVMLTRLAPPEITAETCADVSGAEALAAWGGELAPAPSGTWDLQDLMGWADETYDACATLSWIVIPLQDCCLAGFPFQVMLFHEGEFVQPATDEVYGRAPVVERVGDDEIRITYSWVPDGGSSAGPFDSATSTFRWDEEREAVVREGDLPPVHFSS